jgi:hypothetical protein
MAVNLKQIARVVLDEIDRFAPPQSHTDQLGTPLPKEWFEAGLLEMRAALVEPYSLELSDEHTRPGHRLIRTVVIVADDANTALLAFDPAPEGEFVLAWRHPNGFTLSNIRGDAVGCFLSR